MVRRILPICLLAAVGCLPDASSTQLVPSNPFNPSPVVQTPRQVSHSPAAEETARRVGMVGQKVLLANSQLGVRPLFRTIGAPHAEIFHVGDSQICITEGLVKQCATEAQLAAVICVELGKMTAEREALAGPQVRAPERRPPADMPVGTDYGGTYGPADGTRLAELAKYEKERRVAAAPPLDSLVLAREYLMKSGHSAADLDAVVPLLRKSSANSQLEKQLTTPAGPTRPWTQ